MYSGIKNIVFDMGNVLIRFDPEYFLTREDVTDAQDRELLMQAVFRSDEWRMADQGLLDEAGLEKIALQKLPQRLHEIAHRLIFHWNEPLLPIEGMADFVRECKQKGLGVYLLSNATVRQPSYWPDIPGSEYFDGAVISACERLSKPMPEIYRRLLARYDLAAKECLFVDDMQANVDGAISVGMKGFLFTGDVRALRTSVFTQKGVF